MRARLGLGACIAAVALAVALPLPSGGQGTPPGSMSVITANVHVVSKEQVKIIKAGAKIVSGNVAPGAEKRSATTAATKTAAALSQPTRVEVAVRRLGGPCAWLRNTQAAFEPAGCDKPIWLKAAGTQHWALRLRSALAPGRYVAAVRATDVAGFASATVTRHFTV